MVEGVFGYIIGKKKRMMRVYQDADLLWQLLVREIYILMKYHGSIEELQIAFKQIKKCKKTPSPTEIEKYKIFTDLEVSGNDWIRVLRHCQSSFINILEAGYILQDKDDNITNLHVFILDFNKGSVSFYNEKLKEEQIATIDEIMEFTEMPEKTYTEIVNDMNTQFYTWYILYSKIMEENTKLQILKQTAKSQGAANIEYKVDKLIYSLECEKKELLASRRVFYNRLKALYLIEEEEED